MNETTSHRSTGAAPIVLALACLLLLLFGVWQTMVVISPPGVSLRFDWYHFVPAAFAAVSIALSAFWSVRPPGFSGLKGYAPLLGPGLGLLSAGLVALVGALGFEETTLADVERADLPAPFVAGALFIRAQALGFLWAALAFFAAALSATAAGRFGNGGRSRGRLPWVWVTVGFVGAFDLVLIRSPWWSRWGSLAAPNPAQRALAFDGNMSALDPDAWAVCAPFVLGVLLVAVFPLFLLRLDSDGKALTGGAETPSSSHQVVAPLGFLGGCLCLAQALSTRASANILLSLEHLLVEGELSQDYWIFHEASLRTSWLAGFPTIAFPAIGLAVCALFLYRVRGTARKALVTLVVGIVVFALGISLVRLSAVSPASAMEAEPCDCYAGELIGELSTGGIDLNRDCLPWVYWTAEYRNMDLPVLDAGEPVQERFWAQMPVVSLDSRKVKFDYRVFELPEEGNLDSESIERNENHPFVTALNAAIEEYTKRLDMIAARTGEPPKIESVVFAVEPDVPETLVRSIRRIAAKAGLVHGFFLVRSPGKCGGACRELRVVKAPDVLADKDRPSSTKPFEQALRDRLELATSGDQ